VRGWLQALSLALLLPGLAAGQGADTSPAVTVDIEPREATVGDRLRASFSLTLPEGWEADLPEIGAEIGSFSVISGSWQEPEPLENGTRQVWTGLLTAFETGTLEIPSLSFAVRAAGESSTLESAPFTVEILSTLQGEENQQADIADLKAPLSLPAEYGPILRASAILALLLALSALLWWLHRRYAQRMAAVAVPEDPFQRMAPHVWVYKALQTLLDKRLEEQGLIERFYSELAWILKRYAGGRYRLDLLEKTTAEIPDLLRQAGAAESAIQKMSGLLRRCDLVKFAGQKPAPEASKAAVETVYEIVDATKPTEDGQQEPQKGAA
jgi:hypothetical protein